MKQFREFTTQELIEYIKNFKFTRKVWQYHVHHTWSPNHSHFNGKNHQQLQYGMWNYHTNTQGWGDIGQHLSLFPDGKWLLGRDFNKNPASILGWNTGAFAVEMIGNFDSGNDEFIGAQAEAMYEFSEFVVEEFGWAMKFHRDSPQTSKTCPGSGIDRDTFLLNVANFTENKLKAGGVDKQQLLEEAKKKAEELIRLMNQFKTQFTDMVVDGKPHWSNDYVNFLVDRHIVSGTSETTFEPNRPMTRAEGATIVAKAYESLEEKLMALTEKIDQLASK